MRVRSSLVALGGAALLAGCATRPSPPVVPPVTPLATPEPPKPSNALEAGVQSAAPREFTQAAAERALVAFRLSCPVLVKRADVSRLTGPLDWQPLCTEAAALQPSQATEFFRHRFEWVKVGSGEAFATGYYEPELAGSRVPGPGYQTPIYRTPPDLVRCTRPDGQTGRGRIDETGTCVLYHGRAEIEAGALAGRGLEVAWAADPIELFFLHIQGSGRVRLPDGSVMRIGYDNQNGREYVAVGRLLRDRNILPAGGASMQAIVSWMKAQPDRGASLMNENLSYIFFREVTGPGPLGALNVPVTPQGTVAADPLFIPLGAPVWLDVERSEADGLWVAQDTGGAIKGANRVDTFWGAGPYATQVAGGMAAKGEALVLLPRGTVAQARSARAQALR